jgi:cytochrome P450
MVEADIIALSARGKMDIFPHMKRLMHSIGFLSWIGEDALLGDNLSRLTRAFETLDPETAFQSLWSVVSTICTGKWRERRAIAEIDDVLTGIMSSRGNQVVDDNLNALHHNIRQQFPLLDQKSRSRLVAHAVFQFHLASLANMYAALSWTLINLLLQPAANASRVVEEHERLCRDFGSLYEAFISNRLLRHIACCGLSCAGI